MKNLKTLFSVGVLTMIVSLFSMTPNQAQNEKAAKHKIIHNGKILCLPAVAVESHIRQHNKEAGSFSCKREGLCIDQPVPPTIPPPSGEEPICNGCQKEMK